MHIQLQRALVNILTNAVNYTPEGGGITVQAALSDTDRIQIRIQDTGVGIFPLICLTSLTAFTGPTKLSSRASGGTGLGPRLRAKSWRDTTVR